MKTILNELDSYLRGEDFNIIFKLLLDKRLTEKEKEEILITYPKRLLSKFIIQQEKEAKAKN